MSPVSRTLESYRNVLVAVPPTGPEVCRTCWRDTRGQIRCTRCSEHRQDHGDQLADVVVPIALAERSKQFAHELRLYKDGPPQVRRTLCVRLTAVLAEFLRLHERCLAEAVGVEAFDHVVAVPSTRGRQVHPLAKMLGESILQTRKRFSPVLSPATDVLADRTVRLMRFTTSGDLAGQNLLVVDDTWTTGARMQSACAALKSAGATKIAGLVLGRWFDDEYPPAKAYLERAKAEPFDWERCCLGRSGLSRC